MGSGVLMYPDLFVDSGAL